ncbi:F510_1955 family glycosylhydrolase [Halalkalibacterium ligniniphilum]|uniref:F510_1955 family glycosylhydrolase n=1 Tax=Halalkalibacterium ligniniphilum TaxID=1134413 RepID=UPI001F4080CC|nr:hypothetical protein [Halalkalibacterium ligniniphilum]
MILGSVASLFILSACSTNQDEIESFTHIHGLEYSHEDHSFYVATHMGLLNVNEGEWLHIGKAEHQHDLMGYTIVDENTMMSSGHPSPQSDLVDPLGVMISEDNGETWEPIALYEEVDFHLLHFNKRNPDIMYGIDAYNSNLYHSENRGYDWEMIEVEGLPVPVASIMSLTSHPHDPNYLIAGTENGLFASYNGGQEWELVNGTYTMTAITTLDADSEKVVAYLIGEQEGLFYSEDFGNTWESLNFQLEDDAIMLISGHPLDESSLIVASHQQNIYETKNFGESWETLAEEGRPLR